MKTTRFVPNHPGIVVKKELEFANISIQDAADRMGITRKTMSLIVNGHVPVSTDMAVRFSMAIGQSPQFWIYMQANYDLAHIDKSKFQVKKIR